MHKKFLRTSLIISISVLFVGLDASPSCSMQTTELDLEAMRRTISQLQRIGRKSIGCGTHVSRKHGSGPCNGTERMCKPCRAIWSARYQAQQLKTKLNNAEKNDCKSEGNQEYNVKKEDCTNRFENLYIHAAYIRDTSSKSCF